MAVRKLKKSLLEKILITIVSYALSVKATLSTTASLIRSRQKRQERKAEKKAVDLKPEDSLANFPLHFKEVGKGVFKLKKKKGKK